MRAAARATEAALYAAVAAGTLGLSVWFIGASPGSPSPPARDYLILAALMAAPWLVAVRLGALAWWAGTGARLAALDPPAVLVAAAVAALPDDRREWGAAMAAELAGIPDRRGRWWFATGCARTALFPPRASRLPVLSLAALVAGALLAAGLAVGGALPAARVFAVTFAGVVGALALLLALRAGRVRLPASGPEVSVAGLAGVAAAVAGTAYFLARFPEATRHLTPGMAVLLAAVLGGCLWLTLAPPRGFATHRLPVAVAVSTAVVAGGGVLLTSRLLSGDAAALTLFYALQLPLVAVFSGSVIMAATRGYRAGLQTTVWTALLTSLAIFAVAVPEAARSFQLEQTLIYFGDRIPPDAAGESLRLATWGLLLFPFWWLPFGLTGAGLAAWAARRTARPRVG